MSEKQIVTPQETAQEIIPKRIQIRDLLGKLAQAREEIVFITKGTGGEFDVGGKITQKLPLIFLNQSKENLAYLYRSIGKLVKDLSAFVDDNDPSVPEILDALLKGRQMLERIMEPQVLSAEKVTLLQKECSAKSGFLKKDINGYYLVIDVDQLTLSYFIRMADVSKSIQQNLMRYSLAWLTRRYKQLLREKRCFTLLTQSHLNEFVFRKNRIQIDKSIQIFSETEQAVSQRLDILSSFEIIKESMSKLKNLTDNMAMELNKIERLAGDPSQEEEIEWAKSCFRMAQEQSKTLILDLTTKYLEFPEKKQKALHEKNLFIKINQIKEMFDLDLNQHQSLSAIQEKLSEFF